MNLLSFFLVWKICRLFSSRSGYRTCICTSAAVYASIGVDLVLAVALADCAYGTGFCTSAAADAGFRNFVCHYKYTSIKLADDICIAALNIIISYLFKIARPKCKFLNFIIFF